jgi:hypothetical protein
MWKQVIMQKHIEPLCVRLDMEGYQGPINNVSIIWKDLSLSFPLVQNWLVWKLGIPRAYKQCVNNMESFKSLISIGAELVSLEGRECKTK